MYTDTELIDSIVLELNQLEVKGVHNMNIVISSIQKLAALKRGLEAEKEERRKEHAGNNEPGADV